MLSFAQNRVFAANRLPVRVLKPYRFAHCSVSNPQNHKCFAFARSIYFSGIMSAK
ncbi:hypothetical protein CHK_2652 [Christensenella hongkongensis]|uniref:Uncharacterized protein n=1 Tax=Christensenella hongkongensis TaxID=270498 RepID=A0A0M2NBH4_9FIRM|nr:hypothetical protein CHK_2652 [Christensenella hongkongensis]